MSVVVSRIALGIRAAWIRRAKILCFSEKIKLSDDNFVEDDNEPLVNGRQLIKGSPVMSRGQLQTGVSPLRLQSAPAPQAPSQVFLHIP